MKKLISALLVLLVLVGCSSIAETQISDKDSVLFKINNKAITKGDIYDMVRYQNISQNIVNDAKSLLVEGDVEVNDEIQATAESNLADARTQMGEYFKMYYGERTDEELLETVFVPAAKQEAFVKKYYTENQDRIIEENKPVKLIKITYTSEEQAQAAIEALQAGTEISKVISDTVGQGTEAPVVTALSEQPQVIQDYISSDEGQSKEFNKTPLKDSTAQSFYVVKVEETDPSALKEEYAESFMKNQQAINKLMDELFKEADFKVYDQAIYDSIKSNESLADIEIDN